MIEEVESQSVGLLSDFPSTAVAIAAQTRKTASSNRVRSTRGHNSDVSPSAPNRKNIEPDTRPNCRESTTSFICFAFRKLSAVRWRGAVNELLWPRPQSSRLGLTAAALKPADSRPSPTEKPRAAFTQSFGMIVNERVIIAMQPIRQRNPAEDQAR